MTRTQNRPLALLVAAVLALSTVVAFATQSDAAVPYPNAGRVDGADAVSIGVAVSQATFADGEAEAVVLARRDLFADSLSATGFAGVAKAPILFTSTNSLETKVANEIERVLPSGRVYIMGGFAAVSQKVEDQVEAMGYQVSRFRGADRYQTAALTGRAILFASSTKTVVVARGRGNPDATQGWVDAVSCGAWAADRGYPLLLTDPGQPNLHPQTKNILESEGIQTVHICGGTAAVPAEHEAEIKTVVPNVFRQRDTDRTGTAIKVAKNLWGYGDVTGKDFLLVPGFGDRFAWGVAASQLSARRNAPLLLVDATQTQTCLSSDPGFQTLCYLASGGKVRTITAIGGTNIISDEVLSAAAEAGKLTRDRNPPSTIEDLGASDNPQDDGTKVLLEFTASTDPEGAEVSYEIYYRLPPEPEPEPTEEPSEQPSEEPSEQPSEQPSEEPSEQPSEEPAPEPEPDPLTKENGTRATRTETSIEEIDGIRLVSVVVDLCDLAIPRDPETGEPTSEDEKSTCAEQEYEFIVIAVDEGGNESPPSNMASAAPIDDVPAAPAEAPTAEPASGGFTAIRWKVAPEADAAGYVIERAEWSDGTGIFVTIGAGCQDFAEIGRVNSRDTTVFVDQGTSTGDVFCYRYRVIDTTKNVGEPSPELEEYEA